jgi:NAD(P)-dependent dehydrogenase (short-subunit alcohol dehydrogenase family)
LLDRGGAALLAGRDPERLATAAWRLHRPGRAVGTLPYHASYSAVQVAALLRDAHRRLGDIDVVVLAVGELSDESATRWDAAATRRSLVTNLLGPAVAARATAATSPRRATGGWWCCPRPRPRPGRAAGLCRRQARADAFARGLDRRLAGTAPGWWSARTC